MHGHHARRAMSQGGGGIFTWPIDSFIDNFTEGAGTQVFLEDHISDDGSPWIVQNVGNAYVDGDTGYAVGGVYYSGLVKEMSSTNHYIEAVGVDALNTYLLVGVSADWTDRILVTQSYNGNRQIRQWINDVLTYDSGNAATGQGPPFTVKAEIISGRLRVWTNGSLVYDVTRASFNTGSPLVGIRTLSSWGRQDSVSGGII